MDTDYQAIFLISALIPEYLIFNEHLVCGYKDISINVEQIGFAHEKNSFCSDFIG